MFALGAVFGVLVLFAGTFVFALLAAAVQALYTTWQRGERFPTLVVLIGTGAALLGGTVNYYWHLIGG